MLGTPFVGEAGYMLEELIKASLKQHCRTCTLDEYYGREFDLEYVDDLPTDVAADKIVGNGGKDAQVFVDKVHAMYPSPRIGISNICCCMPLAEPEVEDGSRQIRPPERAEAEACRPRLLELVRIVRPKAIVALGRVPAKFTPRIKDGLPPFVKYIEEIIHPAALCRLQTDDPIRFVESRNRCLLVLTRLKRRLWGLED